MAITGQLTLDEILIVEVDADPSIGGATAPIGSFALLDDNTNARMWIKSGSGDTAWSIVPRYANGTAFSNGSIVFSDSNGFLAQNNAQLFWDNSNNRLGLGLTSPQARVHVDAGTGVAHSIKFTVGTTTGQTSGDGFDIGVDASGNAEIRQRESSLLSMFTSNTQALCITNTQRILISSSNTSQQSATGEDSRLQVHGTNAVDTQVSLMRWSNDNVSSTLRFTKSRGTTIGSHSAVQASDVIGSVSYRASDGTSYWVGAAVVGYADSNFSTNSAPGRLSFFTTPSESTTTVERVRINSSGLMQVMDALQWKRSVQDFSSQAAANTTTSLTSSSAAVQIFTGTVAGQVVKMPDATTLTVGATYHIHNNSTSTIVVQDNGGNELGTISTNVGLLTLRLTGASTANGVWLTRTTFDGYSTGVSSNSLISTTSNTDVLMTGMTIIPPAGTYRVTGRAVIGTTSNNRLVYLSLYSSGSQVANTEVGNFIRSGANIFTTGDMANLSTDGFITVNGSQAIELRWRTSGGTAQAKGYALTITKVNA